MRVVLVSESYFELCAVKSKPTNNACDFEHRDSYRTNRAEVFCNKGVLGNFAKFTGKPEALRPATLSKKTLAQVFSCEFFEISKKTFSYRTSPVAASVLIKKNS